jgi:predicted N-formylglutamate amidohydrolase
MDCPPPLLDADEPPPVTVEQPDGASPFLLACDHAGRLLPRRLGTLGLTPADRERHIAWDIGIAAVSSLVAEARGAVLIRQNYSRLVIDCNRPLTVLESIPHLSETTDIPGNLHIDAAERQARVDGIFVPYHARIAAELDRRERAGRPTVLVSMHSFTPVYAGVARPWHAGVMYQRDPRLAGIMLDLLRAEADLVVGDNEPYAVTDVGDYTIPVHGERRALPHVALEVRQDLIADAAGQRRWADLLVRLLPLAQERLTTAA